MNSKPPDIRTTMTTGTKYDDAPPPYSEMPPRRTGSQTPSNAGSPRPSRIYIIPVCSHHPPPYSDLPSPGNCVLLYPGVPPTALSGLPPCRTGIGTRQPSCSLASPAKCDDHMQSSILSLFLCLPLGIVALVYSFKTRASNKHGDPVAAADHSRKSRKLNQICWIGLLVYVTLISICVVKYILHSHHFHE